MSDPWEAAEQTREWHEDVYRGQRDAHRDLRGIEAWVRRHIGVTGLREYVGASTLLIPVGIYTRSKLEWLNDNLTNSIQIDSRLPQAKKLQQWVDKQHTSTLFSWLLSFEKLELSRESRTCDEEDKAILTTDRSQLFVFQGKPFILSQGHHCLKVRVFWGSEKPILALLAAVTESETLVNEAPLIISTVWHNDTERGEAVRRPLSLIDMEMGSKKWLLDDLKKRGYLLYGPPGTGKTSLAQAITSDYDLELFEVKLGRMTDSRLQRAFKTLPSRCVVLFEDIDAAGIGREDLLKAKTASKEAAKQVKEPHSGWALKGGDEYEDDPEEYCRKNNIKIGPEQSFVTLSGLLNVLDGPGAKEGRIVILTTNSPRTLDKAITRKGRVDRILYLGYTSPESAVCTFKRMFGTDLTFHVPEDELDRLAKRFARKIPRDMFTPCEISDYCRDHRGEPGKAIREFGKFVEDRILGKGDYLYDIKDSVEDKVVEVENDLDVGNRSQFLHPLPSDNPDTDSDGDDEAYSTFGDLVESQVSELNSGSSTPYKVAGSPGSPSSVTEDVILRSTREEDLMSGDGWFSPDWAFVGWPGL
ncbi:hypothetical protein OPT61_g8660 [Boeremia exigua]|uniref:Uncharacterized protein n=1 Tax=Boeremia exigua TaxID=749465 RepID=A0ACC2HXS4_9PLEO|nr:hypothetical protein OPT61_g8660 [Boeremia exigua]